jgi:hypothetical protein
MTYKELIEAVRAKVAALGLEGKLYWSVSVSFDAYTSGSGPELRWNVYREDFGHSNGATPEAALAAAFPPAAPPLAEALAQVDA